MAGIRNDIRFLQVTAPVQQGNSAGPLLDRGGNVVGVISSKLNALAVAGLTDATAEALPPKRRLQPASACS